MRLILGAVIATASIIILGVLIVSPVFFPTDKPTQVILSFNIYENSDLDFWCKDLGDHLHSSSIKGSLFISGKLAEQYPSCITSFPQNYDVGSRTYSYVDLTQISDYSKQLEEVQSGKRAVDNVGNLESKLFKAPYGAIDNNIYSLLSRNGILADFSYEFQYNTYHEDQFLKFDLVTYDSQNISSNSLKNIESSNVPVLIEFDSFMSIDEIEKIISELDSLNIEFVTASDISKMELTRRN